VRLERADSDFLKLRVTALVTGADSLRCHHAVLLSTSVVNTCAPC